MSWDASILWQFDLLILPMVIICAIAALTLKDLVSCAVISGAFSFLMCLLWTEMLAVDVAFTEAAFGAIDSLAAHGASEENLAKVKETQRRQRETDLKENGFWLSVTSSSTSTSSSSPLRSFWRMSLTSLSE